MRSRRAVGTTAARSSTVERIGDAILAQDFEPTPSYETCAMCDYQLTCPAAET
jgi:DNA helicase-2/ATP-dependent DNA helicase PcrA